MNNLLLILAIVNIPGVPKLWLASVITLAFAAFGRSVRGVTTSGAVAGAAVCFALFAGPGWGGFAALCTVFVLTWAATRFGYAQKQSLGTAEPRRGRTAGQVFANLGVAAVSSLVFVLNRDPGFLLAAGAALAEAAADTVSSEIGQAAGGNPRLLTTWAAVPAGTDGAVSVVGTMAGVGAAILVSIVYSATESLAWLGFIVCTAAGIAGTLADSLLGATLERNRRLGNNAVNLCSTLVAAALAFLFGHSAVP